ncbi:hypothetical protein SDC9_157393 [bioreactor metagenome]|uniref:Uncharacterized protein n=1 Tax=bioreactor metagenome TaxID=1076179 RepID=A0A645F871_9ZZZZ
MFLGKALDAAAEADAGQLLLRRVAFGSGGLEAFPQTGKLGVEPSPELFRFGERAFLEFFEAGFQFAVALFQRGRIGVAGAESGEGGAFRFAQGFSRRGFSDDLGQVHWQVSLFSRPGRRRLRPGNRHVRASGLTSRGFRQLFRSRSPGPGL